MVIPCARGTPVGLDAWREAIEVILDQSEAAMRLFFCLRKLDAEGVDEIVAEPITDKGLGMAIMDRLRRAAGKR